MFQFEPEKVKKNVERATTPDLLDRVTVFLEGMEPDAVEIIERELARRGVLPDEVEKHAAQRREAGLVRDERGVVRRCVVCGDPGAAMRWSWQKLFGLVPIFPRPKVFCTRHDVCAPGSEGPTKPTPASAQDHFGASS